MAFLQIGATVIPVDAKSVPDRKKEEIGDRARAIDGTMRQTVYAYKRSWVVDTPHQDLPTTEALETAVLATQPAVCTGDLLNNVNTNCFIQITDRKAVATRGAHFIALQITLYEQ